LSWNEFGRQDRGLSAADAVIGVPAFIAHVN
jgi:hypothetical protein